MKILSTFVRYTLLLFATLLVSTSSYASHILAMDLYYTWVSGNTYKITAVIYGDCGPASSGAFSSLPSAQPQICIFRGNTFVTTIGLNIEPPTSGTDVSPVCPSQVGHTQCEDPGSSIPGVMQFVYSAFYTLPPPTVSTVWRFVYNGQNNNGVQSGRSASITNIVNPGMGSSVISLVDTLDNSVSAHNSNAAFSVIPTPFFCLNMSDTYNPGAVDPDNDSLKVIDLIPARDGFNSTASNPCQPTTPVSYTGTAWPPFTPISATTPLNVVAGSFVYDVTTGQLNFKPNAVQRSTVVYNVREYRAGQFVGSCQREMNFLVQNCTSPPPVGGVGSVVNAIVVDSAHVTTCANSGPFSFTFDPREPAGINNITVTWAGLSSLPTSTLTVTNNGTPTPHVVFAWTSTGIAPGTYIFYLTYTDDNCPLQATITTAISVTILPSAKVTYSVISTTACAAKEAINIIPSGQGSPWTVYVTGTISQTFTGVTSSFVDSLPPGSYTISIGSPTPNRCDTSTTLIVPSSAIIGPGSVCVGAAITLSNALSGGTWSSSNTSVATVVSSGIGAGSVTGISANTVIISYSFPGGCYKTTTVTVKPLPAAITGIMHVCEGFTTVLSDATPGGTWTSDAPDFAAVNAATGVVTGIVAGVVPITYTANGCYVTASVTINVEPAVFAGAANICTDGTTTLSSAPGGGTWSSSNTSTATIVPIGPGVATIYGITTGTTIITYTLGNCSRTTTVLAVSMLPPVTGLTRVCTGQSIVLSDSISMGTWSSANTAIVLVDRASGYVTGLTAGPAIITYSIGGSCTVTYAVTVDQSPDVGIISGLSDLCVGAITALSETATGGAWSSSNSTGGVTSAGVVTAISPGIDTIMYIASNPLCTDTATKVINIYVVPVVGPITGPDVLCVGRTTILSDATAGGVWGSVSTGVATISPGRIVTGVSAGTDTIKYTVSNPGCYTTVSHLITVYDFPDAGAISGLNNLCVGTTIKLSDAAVGGVWTISNTAVATITGEGVLVGAGQGTIMVRYTVGPNAGGCTSVATYTVTVYAPPLVTINNTVREVNCNGDKNGSISIDVAPSNIVVVYDWSNGGSGNSITGLDTGNYILTITYGSTPCTSRDSFHITQPDPLLVMPTVKNDICSEGRGSISLEVTGGTPTYSYRWSTNATDKDITGLKVEVYSVSVTDMHNCMNNLSIPVGADTCVPIVVHDVITPNGDGYNDVWVIEGITNYPANKVQVYDKWGDLVYEQVNYSNNWNGNGKNGSLPDGTYIYLVRLNTKNGAGGSDTFTGTLLIKR